MAKNTGASLSEAEISKVTKNWAAFLKLISTIEQEDIRNPLTELAQYTELEFGSAPASTRTDHIACYPGGLVDYSYKVAIRMAELNKTMNLRVPRDSIILLGLFHDIGKIGSRSETYYVPQTSDWHRDKGMLYTISPNLNRIHPSIRSLQWLNSYGVPMTEQEIDAIASMAYVEQATTGGRFFASEPETVLLQSAVRLSAQEFQGRTSSVL